VIGRAPSLPLLIRRPSSDYTDEHGVPQEAAEKAQATKGSRKTAQGRHGAQGGS
jgi:hypothetical protein